MTTDAAPHPAERAAQPPALPRTLREALPVFFANASPRILATLLLATGALRVALGGFSLWDLAPLAGLLLFWPLQEWLIHVFVLHYKPVRVFGRTLDFPVPRKHRAHHRDPWNLPLLFIPVHSFLYAVPAVAALWWAITPSLELAATGLVGYYALALHYEWVHFLVHTRVSPKTRLYQRLWKNHRRHHFKSERYWYGVTMLGGDRLLGTDPEPDSVPTSPTARDLLGEAGTA
jgi:hypothetical protein